MAIVSHAMYARHLGEHARHAVEPVQGGDDHGDDRSRYPHQHDRHDREPEDHDHHRIEDEDRHRIIGGEERIERLPHARQRVNDDAKRKARHHGNQDRYDDDAEGARDLIVDLPRDQETNQRVGHLRGRDHDAMIDQADAAAEFEQPDRDRNDCNPDPADPDSFGCHPGIAERFHRFAAEVVPQPTGDLAEPLLR